jgi:hypothetical protein
MWDSIFLMNEHTWGWGRSVTEPHSEDSERELAYKRLRASMARDQIDYVLDRAMTAIAGSVETPSTRARRLQHAQLAARRLGRVRLAEDARAC